MDCPIPVSTISQEFPNFLRFGTNIHLVKNELIKVLVAKGQMSISPKHLEGILPHLAQTFT